MGKNSFHELKNKFNINGNFLNLHSIISAVPNMWKVTLFQNSDKDDTLGEDVYHNKLLDVLLKAKKPSGQLYQLLVNEYNDQSEDRYNK